MSIRIVMMWFTKFNTDFSARNKNIIVCKSKIIYILHPQIKIIKQLHAYYSTIS